MDSTNISRYLLEDIKLYSRMSYDNRLTLEIYLRNAAEPLLFSMNNKFSMRDSQVLMAENRSYNPPMRTVINADDIASYSFYIDTDEDEDDEDDGGLLNFLSRK